MDRVRLIPLERAELEDHLALQELVYEHLKRHTGQLLGASEINDAVGGLLSHPSPSVDNLDRLSFSSFAFAQITKGTDTTSGETKTPIAQIARFNSGATGHINYPLDLSSTASGFTYGVYARATTIQSDSLPRRQFSLVTGQEEALTMETRERERIEFTFNKNTPSSNEWVKILTFTKDAQGNYTFIPISMWDEANEKAVDRLTSPSIPSVMLETSSLLDSTPRLDSTTFGLNENLALIRGQLARILHAGQDLASSISASTTKRWYDAPVSSLTDLASNIQSNLTEIGLLGTRTLNVENYVSANTSQNLRIRVEHYYDQSPSSYRNNVFVKSSLSSLDRTNINVIWDHFYSPNHSFQDALLYPTYLTIIRRPIVLFPTNIDYDILSYNVVPLTRHPNQFANDSLTEEKTDGLPANPEQVNSLGPVPFTYSHIEYRTVDEELPLNEVFDGYDFQKLRSYTYNTGSNNNTVTRTNTFPLALDFDPSLKGTNNRDFRLMYEINITFRERS